MSGSMELGVASLDLREHATGLGRARLEFSLFFSLSTDSVDEEEALSKLGPYGHDLSRGVIFLRRNPVSISIDELYVRRRGQKGPTGCVLARAPTGLPGGRAGSLQGLVEGLRHRTRTDRPPALARRRLS